MKKVSFAVASVLLAGSLVAFTACGEGGSVGKVNGNFKNVATAQEVQTALSSIDFEKAFGTGETIGLQLVAEMDVSAKMAAGSNKVAFSFDYALQGPKSALGSIVTAPQASEEENQPEIAWKDYASVIFENFVSAGKFDLTTKQTEGNSSMETTIGASIYQDANAIYLDSNLGGQPLKAKVSVAELLEVFDEMLQPGDDIPDIGNDSSLETFAVIDSETTPGDEPTDGDGTDVINPGDILGGLQEKGLNVYIDDSNGLKLKFSASSELILSAFQDAGLAIDASALRASTIDFYLVFDGNGQFTQVSFDVNVKVKMEGLDFSMQGGLALKSYSGTVTLPAGIANDATYVLIPLRDMIEGGFPSI